MNIHTAKTPAGEVMRAASAASSTMSFVAGSASRRQFGEHFAVQAEPPVLRRYPHLVRYPDVEADFDVLIEKAIAAIADGEPVEDEILGHYVNVASLVRAVSFREGKLLEQAVERLAQVAQRLLRGDERQARLAHGLLAVQPPQAIAQRQRLATGQPEGKTAARATGLTQQARALPE